MISFLIDAGTSFLFVLLGVLLSSLHYATEFKRLSKSISESMAQDEEDVSLIMDAYYYMGARDHEAKRIPPEKYMKTMLSYELLKNKIEKHNKKDSKKEGSK